ncbi:MAG: CaiB/BaiF CoA-transferase family protein [Acidimicrobiales bacterium]|nr:CaiB/BaiF CoA-transferase family protein [Acidimicrobiales bacterium]
MHRPLDGLLVVAIEQAVAGPLCTARMVDAGARVIKVERPTGDFARGYDRAGRGDSSYFAWTNHGKESIVLDLKTDEDAELLHRLIGHADVFVQNLAPGAVARLGFDTTELRAHNPRLITCDISGYGESEAMADKKAYDLLVQAESGLIGISGGANELGRIGISIVDIGTGITAYTAVLEALATRALSGGGSTLKVSLFDVAAEWMTVPFAQHVHGDGGPSRVGLRHPSIAPYGAYETADGRLTLLAVQNEREWERLCVDVLSRPDIASDPRYGSNNDRVTNREVLELELSNEISMLDATTFQDRLSTSAIAHGMVNSLNDLVNHPALRMRQVVSSDGHRLDLPAHPIRHDHITSKHETGPVPKIGEHTADIRQEFQRSPLPQ